MIYQIEKYSLNPVCVAAGGHISIFAVELNGVKQKLLRGRHSKVHFCRLLLQHFACIRWLLV